MIRALITALMLLAAPVTALAQFSATWEFLKAVDEDKIMDVRKHLNNGAMINKTNKDGLPAITITIHKRNQPILAFLLAEPRINVNESTEPSRETPLMRAAATGYIEGLEMLLAKGADVNMQDKSGETAIMKAVKARRIDMVRRLAEAGADFTLADYNGTTVEDLAAQIDRSGQMSKAIAAILEKQQK